MMTRGVWLAATMAALFVAGCGGGAGNTLVVSRKVPIGNGTGRVEVLKDGGEVESVTIRLTPEALQGLPNAMTEFDIPIPSEAGTIFDHVGIDWNPAGHEPPGIYDAPHFDFHYYLLTQAQRDEIVPGSPKFDTPPAEGAAPAGYIVPGPGGVPRMGAHWIDPTSGEFNGQPFGATFIFGFWDGKLAFVEPMVTRSFLQAGTSWQKTIPAPSVVPKHGWYPTKATVGRDGADTVLVLSGMVQR